MAETAIIDAEAEAMELERALKLHGPIRGHCSTVSLLENSTRRGREMHIFELLQDPR